MQERRKQTRKSLMSYSQVFDLVEGTLLGYLADLTQSGAMVISEKPVQVGGASIFSSRCRSCRTLRSAD